MADFVCEPRFLLDAAEWEKTVSRRSGSPTDIAAIVAHAELPAQVSGSYNLQNPSYLRQACMKLRAQVHLDLAKSHLEKVRAAWDEPTDWADLAIYGFYCLEQAVIAAATEYGLRSRKDHRARVQLASRLHKNKGLPDIGKLRRIYITRRNMHHTEMFGLLA